MCEKYSINSSKAVIGVGIIYICIYNYTGKMSNSHICHFVKNYFLELHAQIQYIYIVQVEIWISLSKAVVRVDQPTNTLSLHIQKPYQRKFVYVLIAVILSKNIFLAPKSFMLNMCTLCSLSIELIHQNCGRS